MDEWIWQPLTYIAAVGSHWTVLVSSVLGFLLTFWFAYKGKTLTSRILAAFSIFCVVISMYLAWHDEYQQNRGSIFVSMTFQNTNLTDRGLSVDFTFSSTLRKNYVIKTIDLVRIEDIYETLELARALMPLRKCKQQFPIFLPSVFKERTAIQGGGFWSIMALNTARIDGADAQKNLEAKLLANNAINYKLTFSATPVDVKKFNAFAICPVIEYYDEIGTRNAVACEGSYYDIRDMPGRALATSFGGLFAHYELTPNLDRDHCEPIR